MFRLTGGLLIKVTMQTITTTQLRTYTKKLTNALANGETVKLIHRSKIIGDIKPISTKKDLKGQISFSQAVKKAQQSFSQNINTLPKASERLMKLYRNRLLKKHGKNIY
jgi:antitoxin (DNA-binding transcriptional repressor) of toxin-antitoxin stability system